MIHKTAVIDPKAKLNRDFSEVKHTTEYWGILLLITQLANLFDKLSNCLKVTLLFLNKIAGFKAFFFATDINFKPRLLIILNINLQKNIYLFLNFQNRI